MLQDPQTKDHYMDNPPTTLPCKGCICLPICKGKYISNFRKKKSLLSNMYILIDECELLDDYLFARNNTRGKRIYEANDFLMGNKNE